MNKIHFPNRAVNDSSFSTIAIRFLIAVALVLLIAITSGCSKKTLPINGIDKDGEGITKFELPGSVQLGETVFGIDQENYTITVNVKSGVDVTSIAPDISVAAGAFISPAKGEIVNLNNEPVYKVTLPGGQVQNWKVKVIHQDAPYKNDIFKENDWVIFVGNSITHGGRYHAYIWLYYMTRFPQYRINILNGGIGGDNISNINLRLQEDVLSKNPTVINLTFGMNDSGYFEYLFKDPVEVTNRLLFKADSAFKLIIPQLNAHTASRKIMMAGSPYDNTTKATGGGWSEKPATFDRIVDMQVKAAKENNWKFIDLYHPMNQLNKYYQQSNPKFTLSGTGDRIHPESDGHLVMAYIYLRNQNLKGHEVANFTVDAATARVKAAFNCSIKNVVASATGVSFDYKAFALPFPIDTKKHSGDTKTAADALPYIPFIEDLNREMITIKNLPGNTYELKIDEIVVGRFKASEFATGINMAVLTNTPQYQHALVILRKNEERFTKEREIRDYYVNVFNYARPAGITVDNDPASFAKMRELAKTNGWLNADLYERGSNPATMQQWQNNVTRLIDEIYSITTPLNRKVQIIKVD